MQSFSDTLNLLLEEELDSSESMQEGLRVMREIDQTKQSLRDLQHRLDSIKNKINADLAISVRKTMPALNVGLDKNGFCKIGYKTKHLTLNPDIENRVWVVTSTDPRFSNRFIKNYRRSLIINVDMNNLLQSIITYFNNYYKSLGESVVGVGSILIEGKECGLNHLVNWRDSVCTPRLMSRAILNDK